MQTAKIIADGGIQSVRLPKDFRFTGDEVYVRKLGEAVMLFPKEKAFETFLDCVNGFTDDYFNLVEKTHAEDIISVRETL